MRSKLEKRSRAIVVMGKLPCPGRVKTRIAVDVGDAKAAELYEAFLRDVLDLAKAEADLLGALCLFSCAVGEDQSLQSAEALCPRGVRVLRQSGADLGARMEGARAAAGAQHVVILGSDAPTMPRERILDAFIGLDRGAYAVFGPTFDGGYDLLGLSGSGRRLFEGVTWSTERVMAQSRAAAARAGLEITELGLGYDIDHVEDMPRALDDAEDGRAPRTRAALRDVLKLS